MRSKGKIFRDCLWIKCGVCEFETPTGEDTRADGATVMRKHGWKLTKEHGWICDACANKRKGTG